MAVLTRLIIKDFRNYESIDLEFADGINVFIGANGQGKSNLLESIYFLSILRSFRCSKVKNLYRWRQPSFMMSGRLNDNGHTTKLGVEYGEKRRLRINGESIHKASDFIGKLYTVAFVPEDIDLVKGTASIRRRFLDITLSQRLPGYLQTLQAYEKALKSRNALLRKPPVNQSALVAYDEILIRYGSKLIFDRLEFFAAFEPFINKAAADLLPEEMQFTLRYQPVSGIVIGQSYEQIREIVGQSLANNIDRDKLYGMTHSGPHRDDIMLFINNRNLADFGSEGQCRLAAMILKLAKALLLYEEKGEDSITLLVDDVIGELDERGCKAFMACVSRADQVFIACTEAEKLHGIEASKTFIVKDGSVSEL